LSKASIAPLPVQADLPMWIGGSSEAAIRRTARVGTGWQAGPETPEVVGEVIAGIKAGLLETGRTIEEDHYGAAFAFRFGGPDDPGVAKVMEHYRARTGRDPRDMFAMGDAEVILSRWGPRSLSCGRSRMGMRICWRRPGGWWRRCCLWLRHGGRSSGRWRLRAHGVQAGPAWCRLI